MPESFFIGAATNAVGTLMVDYLVKPIECRVRYLFRFHMIVQELHEQQNNLNREQTRIQEDIKEAKLNIQTQVIEKYVEDWLTDATNALNNVQNLEARIEENKRCFHWCPNWSWRYQLSKSMDEEILAIIKLVNNSKFERIGHCAELPGLELFTSKGLVDSKSSTTAFNKIMKALKDAEINKIGVWGMGGVGKTTLVKEVGNKVKGFGQPIMVVISKIPDIGEIQKKIADGIHLKFEKTTKDGRAKELWCRLKEGKFIIILDDLWNEWNDDEDLRKIGIPLVENGKGCKIILTTRRWTVCKSMECQVTIQIDVLDDDEAWALFKMNANLDENVSRNIIEEAEKIVKECNGLPVAIVTLGRSLKGTKTQKGWELARKKLESSRLMEIGNIEEEEKNAYMCIKMSYEYLKKEVTKRCFLLCALYPEDHSIDVEDLVRYALALELYGKVDSVEEVRVQVLEAIDYLKDSCLLLKDTQWYIKLHDLVRDVALWIASREESGFMIKSRLELLNESFEPCRAISLLNIEEKKLLGRLIPSNLEILLLKNCDVQVSLLPENLESFEVLDDIDKFLECLIDKSLRLSNLKLLYLHNLSNLSCIGELPTQHGDGLNGLTSLQLRDCKDLECLVDITTGNGPTFAFTNLKRLSIEDMFGFETLCKGHHPPQGFLQSLKVVNIKGCRKLEILFSPSITQSLVFLEELTIEFCRELRTLFSVLENDGGIRSNSCFPPFCLPKLKTLYIRLCSKLEYVLPITLAQGLPALASISVFGCDELKHVFSMPKEQDGVELHGLENLTSFVPENFFIKAPALKSLEAYECPKVMNFHIQQVNKQLTLKELSCNTNLIPDVHSRHLDGLTSLDIYHWWGGECLVDKSQAKMGILQNLKDLRVSYSSMSEVFRIDEGLYNREENQAPQLLLNLEQLQLKRLPYLRWIVQGPIHCVNLQSLKVLEITHCNKLTSIFSISVVQTLRSLEELKIYDCDKLKSVLMELEIDTEPNKLCLPNLKTVEIVKCPSLEYVFPLALTQGFPRLQKVQLVKLRNMRGFVAGNNFVQAPALEILIIKELCSAFTNFVFQKEVNKCDPLKELTFCTKSIDGEDVEPCNMVNTQLRQRSTNFEYMTLGNFEQLFRLQGACFISNLEKMQLSNMIWLRDIWKGPIHFESNLRELAVYDSNCLTYIFPATFIPHFPHLSILKIKACENLKQIIANDDISTSSSQGPQLEKKMVFPHIKQIILENFPRLERFGLAGYHMEFPCLDLLDVKQCFKMITSFTVDYLTLTVHAKSNEASQLDDFNPSPEVIFWEKRRPTLLPQYVEEAEKVSPLK
ncbi:hypothetical protein E1A91_A06G075100v1 [Gossypium mustelinum]|uniref:Uncharacterized protein n=1 Tax=Gossypium mustelinum TaxID=34275 RepID=A0A5D2YSS8_GOSMU|nr:hypothetical protein E1A91_A06G075100v1 [Gossypium mustelinum]